MTFAPSPLADMTLPQDVTPAIAQTPVAASTSAPTAAQMYEAAKAYREAIQDQYDRIREVRSSIAQGLRDGENRVQADISGLEARLKQLDEQLLDAQKQLNIADARVAQAASVPGAILPPPPRDNTPDWEDVLAGGAMLSFALLFPFAIAYSRRIWRRSAKVTVTLPPDVATRMQAMEEAIESVAVEVERIGEGQRFMTQALSEQPKYVGAGAAEPIMVRAREAAHAEQSR